MREKPTEPRGLLQADPLRQKLLGRLTSGGMMAVLVAYLAMLLRVPEFGFKLVNVIQSLIFCILLGVFLARKRLGLRISAAGLLAAVVALVLAGMANFGIFSAAVVVVPFITVLSSMVFGRRVALWLFCIISVILLLIGGLFAGGVMPYRVDVLAYAHSLASWAVVLIVQMLLGLWYLFMVAPIHETHYRLSERLEAVLQGINDALFIHDKDTGAILQVNQKMCAMYGCSSEEALRLGIGELSAGTPPYDIEHARSWIAKAVNEGPQLFEWQAKDCQGRLFWVEVNMRLANLDGTQRLLVVVRDISARKQSERDIRQLQANLSALIESTDDLIWSVDLDCGYLAFNRNVQEHIRQVYGTEIRVGLRPHDLMPAGRAAFWTSLFERALAEGPLRQEMVLSDGRVHELTLNPIVSGGEKVGVSVFAKDVTERRQAEAALRESEDRFNKAFQFMPVGAGITTLAEGRFIAVNRHFVEVFGYSEDELLGRTISEFGIWVDPKDRAYVVSTLKAGQPVHAYECQIRRKDGSTGWASYSGDLVVLGGETYLLSGAVDVTQQKQAEAALHESEARYRTLVDSAPEAIVVLDADQDLRFVDANENACRLFGCGRSELLQMRVFAISPPTQAGGVPSAEAAKAYVSRALEGHVPIFEWIHCKASGECFPCEVRLVRLPAGDRRLIRGSVIDISERKRLEKQATELQSRLDQAQRLEAIGTLAGGIAHDFNNILGAIIGYTDLALMELPDDSPTRELLENVERGGARAVDLVRQILTFSRQSKQERKPIQPVLVVKEALKLLRASLPATITVNEQCDSSAWVLADAGQVHQIVMNLCTNAGLAMREHGGLLEVSMHELESDADPLGEPTDLQPGRYVCLTVKDTGCGIPPENLGRIFEPFFTTRAAGEGTGLGLSVVHGIVKSWGGAIKVASEVGRGTTFQIFLPTCEANARGDSEGKAPKAGHECVLFVDDEKALTEVARRGLGRFGYDVRAFNDPLRALEAFRASPENFDVVVTDMTMPGLTGDVLADEVRRIRPAIPVVLVSGFSDRLTAEQARAAGFDGFVDKPLRPSTLAQLIRKLCHR